MNDKSQRHWSAN